MWTKILKISKNKQHYADVTLAREHDVAIAQARDFAARFPRSEGFQLRLYQFDAVGQPLDFSSDSAGTV